MIRVVATLLLVWSSTTAQAQEPKPDFSKQKFAPPTGLARLAPDADVWLDAKRKRVVVDGQITLRRGPLEMFACSKGTKEHESIVAVNSRALHVHAGLLAIGAKSGHPVQFDPEYKPATGSVIVVTVLWKDEKGKEHKLPAQKWVRNSESQKEATFEWVFAGSGFWTDPTNGERYYHADGGDFICVSNFPTATLDLTVESSQTNTSLMFEAFTDRIPPRGTPVRLILTEKKKPQPADDAKSEP